MSKNFIIYILKLYVSMTFYIILILFVIMLSIIFLYSMNKPYFVSCSNFLELERLELWKEKNAKTIKEIEKILKHGGELAIAYDKNTCPGKVGIAIYHNTGKQRNMIIKKIGSLFYFDGIPYKTWNI